MENEGEPEDSIVPKVVTLLEVPFPLLNVIICMLQARSRLPVVTAQRARVGT